MSRALKSQTPARVSVRVAPGERALLETAAEQSRTSLSDFIRRKALEAAEIEVLDHRIITIPAEAWESFETWADSPAKPVAALRELASRVAVRIKDLEANGFGHGDA